MFLHVAADVFEFVPSVEVRKRHFAVVRQTNFGIAWLAACWFNDSVIKNVGHRLAYDFGNHHHAFQARIRAFAAA